MTENKLQTDSYRDIFKDIWAKFSSSNNVSKFIDKISAKKIPIRRDELIFYLQILHFEALDSIYEIYHKSNFIKDKPTFKKEGDDFIGHILSGDFIDMIESGIKRNEIPENIADKLFGVSVATNEEMKLIRIYNSLEGKNNKYFIIRDFPNEYLKKVNELLYPQWLAACFMSQCDNSSIWGTYGNNHQGVCLIFSPEKQNEEYFLTLKGVTGDGENRFLNGERKERLYPVKYIKGFEPIDFFKSIGRLSRSDLFSGWYSDKDGNVSECADDIMSSEKKWQNRYWDNFIRDATRKTHDWEHENEYRIVRSNAGLTDLKSMEERILTYDFSSLHGLIFGINTKESDKIKIMRIIEKKCKDHNRKDFKFYQAYYCHQDHCIKHRELSLLKFSQ